MTHAASQLLVGGDKAVHDWLLDRFGIDVDKVYIRDRLEIIVSRGEAMVMRVDFYVGADDLASFPQVAPQPKRPSPMKVERGV